MVLIPTVPPLHIDAVVGDTVGLAFTVTAVLVAFVEQVLAAVAVNVYTPPLPVVTPATEAFSDVALVIDVPPGPVHA